MGTPMEFCHVLAAKRSVRAIWQGLVGRFQPAGLVFDMCGLVAWRRGGGNRRVQSQLEAELHPKGEVHFFASPPFKSWQLLGWSGRGSGHLALTGTCSHFWLDCVVIRAEVGPPSSPTACWDTSHVPEDCGTIHKVHDWVGSQQWTCKGSLPVYLS